MIGSTLIRPSVTTGPIPPRDRVAGLVGPGYRIDRLGIGEREILAVTLSGTIAAKSLVLILDELERLQPPSVLIDESAFKASLITPADIEQIARRWATAEHLRTAFIAVIAPNPVVYGLNRMFQLVADSNLRLGVFWNRTAALEWLGRSSDVVASGTEQRRQA